MSVLSGRASCSRISRGEHAAGDEEAERGDDEAPADRLVVDRARASRQARRVAPGRARARASAGASAALFSARRSVSVAVAHCRRPQVGDQRLRVVGRQAACAGMFDARLDALRVGDPARQVLAACWAACRRRACARLADVGEVGRRARAGASVPWIAWHIAQVLPQEHLAAALRRRVGGLGAPARAGAAAQRSYSLGRLGDDVERHVARAGSRRTRRTGRDRCRAGRRETAASRVRPGIRSFLPCRFGTQKLWITSSACSVMTTGRPTGTCSSLAVVKMRDGSASS